MRIAVLGGNGPCSAALGRAIEAIGQRVTTDPGGAELLVFDDTVPDVPLPEVLEEVATAAVGGASVVVITSRSDGELEALIAAGTDSFVRWPDEAETLRARLSAALARAARNLARDGMARKYELLFHNELDAISITDLGSGTFIDVNEAWQKLYGYAYHEAVGRMGPRDVSAEISSTQTAIGNVREGTPCKHVRWHRSRAGAVFPVEIFAGSYALAGRRVLVSMIRDISERVRLETQLRQADRLASVGTLAAGVAHEINNPMAFVLTNLEYLQAAMERHRSGTPLELEAIREALAEARDGAQRVREIVRDLKSFSREDEVPAEPVDVSAVMDVSVRLLGNEIRHRATLRRDYQPGLLSRLNDARLGQVFVNLLSNALQALPERPREQNQIAVSIHAYGDELVAEVRDNGQGIAPEHLGRIFDPFFTTKPVGKGTGLGLAICQTLVTSFGGRIEVQSEVGAGTAFRVHLPRAERPKAPADAALVIPPEPQPEAPPRPPRPKLLLIDDERNLGVVLGRALESDLDLAFVTNGLEGLKRIQTGEQFDAVICDLMMPAMSGMEFYEALCRVDSKLAERTGFITGGTFTPPARDFAARMSGRVIEKPFMADELHALVRTLVSPR